MRILALDCSQLQAAVTLVSDGALIRAKTGSVRVAHSEALLGLVHETLEPEGGARALDGIDAFAVGIGPGSFTGIRIGCATIKGLAQATGRPTVVFSSLRAAALSWPGVAVVMMDAYQSQVFVGWESPGWHEAAMGAEQWCEACLASVPGRGGSLVFGGTGVARYWDRIESACARLGLSRDLISAAEGADFPTPRGVAAATAEALARRGALLRYSEVSANYARPSAAEIKFGVAKSKAR